MIEKLSEIEEWRKLFQAISKVKDIAPWSWMNECNIFAVQNPETYELGFVSVMGSIGEHYAISVYLGERGIYGFWDLHHSAPDISPQMLFEIPQLQASFEDRNFLHSRDRDLIQQLGLKYRGRQSWPLFRSYRPGFFPWFLESTEVRFLLYVLEQIVDVSLRFKKDRSLLRLDNENYFVRVPIQKEDKLIWQDSILKVSLKEPYLIKLSKNKFAIEALKKTVPSKVTLEVDLFMLTRPVQEKDGRPFYPYVLMMVDTHRGMIVGNQLLQPLPTLEAMWGNIPAKVAEILLEIQLLPEKILVSSDILYRMLLNLSDDLGFSLKQSDVLPNLDQAYASLLEYFE